MGPLSHIPRRPTVSCSGSEGHRGLTASRSRSCDRSDTRSRTFKGGKSSSTSLSSIAGKKMSSTSGIPEGKAGKKEPIGRLDVRFC